jgi:hypothetical protein
VISTRYSSVFLTIFNRIYNKKNLVSFIKA